MRQQLDIAGTMVLESEGTRVEITGSGDVVNVDLPNFRASSRLREVADSLAGLFGKQGDFFRVVQQRADVKIQLRLGKSVIGTLDPHRRPGFLSRLLGAAPFRVHLGGLVWAKLRGY